MPNLRRPLLFGGLCSFCWQANINGGRAMFVLGALSLDNHNLLYLDALANKHLGMGGVVIGKQGGCHSVVVVP